METPNSIEEPQVDNRPPEGGVVSAQDQWITYALAIDHGRDPDWEAGEEHLKALRPDQLQSLAADFGGAEGARKWLFDAHCDLVFEWALRDVRPGYEVWQVRDADLHILYGSADDPGGLWEVADALADGAPGYFEAVGFDGEQKEGS